MYKIYCDCCGGTIRGGANFDMKLIAPYMTFLKNAGVLGPSAVLVANSRNS